MHPHLRVIDYPKSYVDTEVGDMWRDPHMDAHGREAWMICLPGKETFWCTVTQDEGVLWDVSGEPPNITVTPSISVVGGWHGFITNGELVDA